jgi:hypothetical protein
MRKRGALFTRETHFWLLAWHGGVFQVENHFSKLGNTLEIISPLSLMTLDIFTIFGFFYLANYLLTFD